MSVVPFLRTTANPLLNGATLSVVEASSLASVLHNEVVPAESVRITGTPSARRMLS